jgi:hypothetical protein
MSDAGKAAISADSKPHFSSSSSSNLRMNNSLTLLQPLPLV